MSARRRSRHGPGPRPPGDAPATVIEGPARPGPAAVIPVPAPRAPVADDDTVRRPTCTLAQLRRFIKSRPYVPLHELRRRFAIEGYEDEVNSFGTDKGPLYVGLPPDEARMLGELVRSGEVGYELLLDPCSPAIVGVFPMRPVARL